jgi:hypothetical protein
MGVEIGDIDKVDLNLLKEEEEIKFGEIVK